MSIYYIFIRRLKYWYVTYIWLNNIKNILMLHLLGAFFIQTAVKKFDELLMESMYGSGKLMENVLLVIANVYNFKVRS